MCFSLMCCACNLEVSVYQRYVMQLYGVYVFTCIGHLAKLNELCCYLNENQRLLIL